MVNHFYWSISVIKHRKNKYYAKGTVYVTVPSGQVFTASTQGQIYLNAYYYGSQPYNYLSLTWQIQISTPSGLRNYYGYAYGVY